MATSIYRPFFVKLCSLREVDVDQAMLKVIETDSGKSWVSLLVVGMIGIIVLSGSACVGVSEIPWDGLRHSYAFYIRFRMNISEGPPMHDSSTMAANLSVAVIGKPTWPLISEI